MPFRLTFCIAFLLLTSCLLLHAQGGSSLTRTLPVRTDTPADSLKTDSVVGKEKRKSWFTRMVQWIDFNNPDPRYITPNLYNFTFMLNTTSSYEHYRIASSSEKEQSLTFVPTPSWRIGAYFGWRWIFLGWSVDVHDLFGKDSHRSQKSEFNLSLYSAKLGADIYYLKSSNNFKVKNVSGFDHIDSRQTFRFDGLKSEMKGINLYYIFNNRRFSYPAAYSQSTNQRKSAGSLIAGFSYSRHKFLFDPGQLPEDISGQLEDNMRFRKIRYIDYSLNFGYGYNWVFAKNCLANLSVTPAVGYKASDICFENEAYNETDHNINFDVITRAAVVYNNTKYYVGASLLAHTYDYHRKRFWINNTYGILQFYVGFNFNKKR